MSTSVSLTDTPTDTDTTIGWNVHAILHRRDSRQKELAAVLGVTPSVLSKKLRGESAWSARQVAMTSAFLGVEPGRLFEAVTAKKIHERLRSITGLGTDPIPRTPLTHVVG